MGNYTQQDMQQSTGYHTQQSIQQSMQQSAEKAPNEKKTPGQRLADKLGFEIKNCWEDVDDATRKKVFDFAEEYKTLMDCGKTEREFTKECVDTLIEEGYVDLEGCLDQGIALKPGMKVYQNIKGKTVLFAVVGSQPIADGVNIVGAHVDSPRIDLKTNPLYEDTDYAMLDTQYYGGIKKYQWVTIPLALHGVVIKQNGEKVTIRIGEEESDPVFVITDLLPHLAKNQMEKRANEFIPGESLNVLAGSIPYKDKKAKEKVKLNLLNILHEKYGIVEEDFSGAELEIVPAFKAKDVGLDRSMIGAYGHDDRSCAYAAMCAVLTLGMGTEIPKRTSVCVLTDKEEVGSMGNTGAESKLFENFIAYLCASGNRSYSDITLRRCLNRSTMLSADVNPAVDPNFEGVQDKKTASYLGKGIVLTKYTGSRGKGGGSDANAEFVNQVRTILNRNHVTWQYGDLGKVDQGGGGTIAQHIANLGVEVLDCGIPVLSMHAPFEVISKIDLYMTYLGYVAFLKEAAALQ